jgi:TolA-binding protein
MVSRRERSTRWWKRAHNLSYDLMVWRRIDHPGGLDRVGSVCYCQVPKEPSRRMPKQRRAAMTRSPAKKQKPRPSSRLAPASAERDYSVKEAPRREPPGPPPPIRKPAFYEALALYESGVRALQRHDFGSAAGSFRDVIQGYPDERELVERSRLYLQVCERETARRIPEQSP